MRERDKLLLPLTDAQRAALAELSVVSLTVRPGGIQVETRGTVGHFDLGGGDSLVIRPKATAAGTALAMLSVLRRLGGLQVTADGMSDPDDMTALLVQAYLSALRKLRRHGLQRGYQRRVSELPTVRGRLDPVASVMPGPMSRGRVVCAHHPRAMDIPENTVLRWVTHRLSRLSSTMPAQARDARELDARLGQIPLRACTASDALRCRRSGSFRAYEHALGLAHLLLAGWSWTAGTGRQGGFTWSVNMDLLFQDWLAHSLSRAPALRGVQVDDDRSLSLATWRRHAVPARPDLVLRRQGAPTAVLDAKHIMLRGTPAAGLIQQVLTYGVMLGLDEAWLVYPAAPGKTEARRCWSVARPGQPDFSVWTAPLRLWSGLDVATRDVHLLAEVLASSRRHAARETEPTISR
ncbi:MAG: 5-methylcytosine-specific restriction endonuclease McrBC regulatory subunit McrC [Myxococcota bacterium]|jgi:5-methylcytosine-specific restriction endonuclease McrBC regulatory subunit McrC